MQTIKFIKGHTNYRGIQFLEGDEFKEDVIREFAGVLNEDPIIHRQIVAAEGIITKLFFHSRDLKSGEIDTFKEFQKKMEVAIIQEGTSHTFFQTLYVFHNDWLLLDESTNRLLVVDENKISNFMKRVDVEA